MDRTSSHLKLLPNVTSWKRIFPVKNGSILGWKRTRFSNLETEDPVDRHPSIKIMSSHGINKQNCLVLCFGCILSLIVGILIGWFSKPVSTPEKRLPNDPIPNYDFQHSDDTIKMILAQIDKEHIKRNLRNYTYKPRLTGTQAEKDLVNELYNTWKENGLHKVIRTPYKVLLSYPNSSMPNKVEILNKSDGSPLFTSQPYEKNLTPEDTSFKLVPPYNSFSPKGFPEGELIYVNYGTIDDFEHLYTNYSINFTSKIVIARYGKIFRGDKLKIAARYNASGLILYTDPADFNLNGFNNTYPHSWWLPPEGVQRGTVGADGDYLTPLYPATDYAHRQRLEDIKLPQIPCQPIGYGDAQVLLSNLTGEEAPTDWQGKLPIKYRIGPGFLNKNWYVKLTVNNYEKLVTTWNVIGYIKGSEEPDRFVMLGNHHDSWVYSAIDPLSGTAALTEITRVMGNMAKKGWQPKRTIVFCSWGGEEQGLIGSTEWVEEHMKVLFNRGVAYLNMDYAVDYTYKLEVFTSPLLQDAVYEAAKKIPNPDPSSSHSTLYEIWKFRTAGLDKNSDSVPEVSYSLGSGSDMATFYQRAGVPSIDFYYTYDSKKWPVLSYPTYHTAYETFYMYSTFVDPSFNYTLAITQFWAVLAYDLATADVLPFDLRRYSNAIALYVYSLRCDYEHLWKNHSVNYESLINASIAFVHATEHFHNEYRPSINKSNLLEVRRLNDKMIGLERAFIDPEGIPGKPMYKHIVYAPNEHDSYTDAYFPGIREAMWKIMHEYVDLWELVKQQVSVATYTVMSAAQSLDEIGLGFNKH